MVKRHLVRGYDDSIYYVEIIEGITKIKRIRMSLNKQRSHAQEESGPFEILTVYNTKNKIVSIEKDPENIQDRALYIIDTN